MAENLRVFDGCRRLVVDALNDIDGISCADPDGAFYVFPCMEGLIGRRCPNGYVIKNGSDLVTWLLEDGGVAVVQGSAFGLELHFRISYAISSGTRGCMWSDQDVGRETNLIAKM